jgi:Fic family protein
MKNALIFIVCSLIYCTSQAQECENKNNEIKLEQINEMFGKMKNQSNWNIMNPMLFGYFFYDKSEEKLKSLNSELTAKGYKIANLFFNGKSYTLHVEKIESHSPLTLHKRNKELGELAKSKCIQSYDGFDVGPAPKS